MFAPELAEIAASVGPVAAGFCTHAQWEHILWHRAFGADTPRYASAETIALIQRERESNLNSLKSVEERVQERGEGDGSEQWDRSLLFKEKPIAWGAGSIAGVNVEVIPVPGHEDGQAALVLPDHRVAFVADTLSDIETPSVSDGSRAIALYLHTLDRLQAVVDRVDWIIPGHGLPADRAEAQRRLDADRRYLEALGPMVDAAPAGEGAEDLAKRILVELGDDRAESELAASMHLGNIQQLMEERRQRESGIPDRRSSALSCWMRIIVSGCFESKIRFDSLDPARRRVERGELGRGGSPRAVGRVRINDAALGPWLPCETGLRALIRCHLLIG